MGYGAHTPEDLEMLLEDTLVLENVEALAELFEEGALMAVGAGHEVRGAEDICRFAGAIWAQENTYVADLGGVTQAGDLALIVTSRGVNVARRGIDGSWRYVILVAETVEPNERTNR